MFARELAFSAPESWQTVDEPLWEQLAPRAAELLTEGPLFLVPTWERRTDSNRRREIGETGYYLEVMAACRPSAPDAVMAVLLPANPWVPDQPWAAEMRTKLAEHWDILLLVYGGSRPLEWCTDGHSAISSLRLCGEFGGQGSVVGF